MKKESITNMCIFLKLLWETTQNLAISLTVSTMAKDLNVPYYSVLGTVLVDKGIVQNTGNSKNPLIIWASSTEPNEKMARAILEECHNRLFKKKETNTNYALKTDKLELKSFHLNKTQTVIGGSEFEKKRLVLETTFFVLENDSYTTNMFKIYVYDKNVNWLLISIHSSLKEAVETFNTTKG